MLYIVFGYKKNIIQKKKTQFFFIMQNKQAIYQIFVTSVRLFRFYKIFYSYSCKTRLLRGVYYFSRKLAASICLPSETKHLSPFANPSVPVWIFIIYPLTKGFSLFEELLLHASVGTNDTYLPI